MAFIDMQGVIADELARSDLTTEIAREILNAITFYENKSFWFNEAAMALITTVQGQRRYNLPGNFASVMDVLSTIGNYTYRLDPRTEQYLDAIDWGNNFWSGYPTDFSLYNGQIRLFPPPAAALPVTVKGTVLLPVLTTATPSRGSWQPNTLYNTNDTAFDGNGNVITALNGGTSGASAPTWATGYLQTTNDGATPIVWQLTGAPNNAWMTNAEELIRTRACRQLYARYIRDTEQYELYTQLEKEALQNLNEKNVGQTALNRLRAHI